MHGAVGDDGFLVLLGRADMHQPPVHHEHLSEAADHDVVRLDVPVQHPAVVCVGQGLTDPPEHREQSPHRPVTLPGAVGGEDLMEGVAADLAHREVGPTIGQPSDLMDRHDAGVFELGGGLGFSEEALNRGVVIGQLRAQHLEGHQPVQALVVGAKHLSHSAGS